MGAASVSPVLRPYARLVTDVGVAFMEEFFGRTGNTKLRFKPAYNPYTEVSGERRFGAARLGVSRSPC